MTGEDMLEALSFVDDTYIEEAEIGSFSGVSLRKILPLAACLCLLIGAFWQGNGETVESQQAQDSSDIEIVILEKDQESQQSVVEPALEGDVMADVAVHTVVLRIVEWNDNGFTATVDRSGDSDGFLPGETVLVEFATNVCIEVISGDLMSVTRRIPTPADFPVGTLVQVRYGSVSDVILAEAVCRAPGA